MKYCLSKRDKYYVAMDRDTSARPDELLKKNIEDIQMKADPSTGRQYDIILVSGKTEVWTLPWIHSLLYVKEEG